eukprot:4788872-Prorocentrum_lima.AAC.1
MSPSPARGGIYTEHEEEEVLVLTEETTMMTPGPSSSGQQQPGHASPRVQFRQMTEMNLDANALKN